MKTRRGRTLVTAALLAFAALFCVLAFPLSPAARRFPLAASLATLVMASLQLAADLRRPAEDGAAGGNGNVGENGGNASERSVLLWTAALVAGAYVAGLSVALPLFAGLYWRLKDGAPWPSAIGAGLCVFGFVQGILGSLLRVELYGGMVGQWLQF